MKALAKEMYNVGVAFEILAEGQPAPRGWHKVTGHLVWDVKMDFTHKARWVLDGHKTLDAEGSTYAGVVSRESVRILFLYAALNRLVVFSADICNAYLQAPSSRKDYIICGAEFGIENIGHVGLIHRVKLPERTSTTTFDRVCTISSSCHAWQIQTYCWKTTESMWFLPTVATASYPKIMSVGKWTRGYRHSEYKIWS